MARVMMRRLLIANRGEIACRVIRTARRLGVHTIAVYSDADAGARHVREADEAWRLGPPSPRDSYLAVDRIIDLAIRAGADAIHPGYGFLSERAEFAAACAAAGIAFIGPPAEVIAAMGSKSASKEAMLRAGVPVLPGYHGAAQSLPELEVEARKVGLPLIIKPSGGGGGKGMQIVESEAALPEALASARRLAENAFGDATLLIERYLPAPRHVEVQVLCDTQGNVLHLHTRDCSVQRRHQKLIEEAPAPGIAPEVRERLHEAGVRVARAVGYVNAGTVEFLYSEGEFWFMEMNTRLQVEHCVTEEILGLDLVEWQLRIAAGEALPFSQADLVPRGHAIEARVCAEDPAEGFVPSAGRLAVARWPEALPDVRVDHGFESGDVVPTHYDSLLGKVVGRGASRSDALAALGRGLAAVRIQGVATNAAWLAGAIAIPAFASGDLSTRFVATYGDALAVRPRPTTEEFAIMALALALAPEEATPTSSPWDARDAFRVALPSAQIWVLRSAAAEVRVELIRERVGYVARVGAERHVMEGRLIDGGIEVTSGGRRRRVEMVRDGERVCFWRDAARLDVEIVDPRRVDLQASAHEGELVARLPGTVVAVSVAVGDVVEAGAVLLVIEAMKMEHTVLAPRAGVVAAVNFAKGDRVPEGAVLVEFASEADATG